VQAEDRLYFSGPIQVRTSYSALFLSGALFGLLTILIGFGLFILGVNLAPVENVFVEWPGPTREAIAMWLIFGTIGASVLLFIPNLFAHHVARWMKVTSVGGYAGVGFLSSLALCFVIPPLGVIALLPCPLAMMLYRRMVGIEPIDLPSDLVVDTTDALVAADHPRRQYRRVLVRD